VHRFPDQAPDAEAYYEDYDGQGGRRAENGIGMYIGFGIVYMFVPGAPRTHPHYEPRKPEPGCLVRSVCDLHAVISG